MTKLGLLNTSIITKEGMYTLKKITLQEAQDIVRQNIDNLDSAIGHQSTSEIMSTILEAKIDMNRQQFQQEVGQKCLVFKLNGRPQEGQILTTEQIKNIGYTLQLLERLE